MHIHTNILKIIFFLPATGKNEVLYLLNKEGPKQQGHHELFICAEQTP